MSKTFLIIGIIVTGLSALVITIVSLSRFILKRIYKEEEKRLIPTYEGMMILDTILLQLLK